MVKLDLIILALGFILCHVAAQNGRLSGFQALDDMRQISANTLTAVLSAMASAVPGQTYPTLSTIPATSFSCSQVQQAGYYADPDTGCQVFRMCLQDGGFGHSSVRIRHCSIKFCWSAIGGTTSTVRSKYCSSPQILKFKNNCLNSRN